MTTKSTITSGQNIELGTEMPVTVLANKKGLWISLRPEQSEKGTVGSP